MVAERVTEASVESPKRAIRIPFKRWGELRQFVGERRSHWQIDIESNSYVFSESEAAEVLEKCDGEDVTDIYQELQARTDGFRIIKVGSGIDDGIKGKTDRATNTLALIEDYSKDEYLICQYGEVRSKVPAKLALDILCSGNMAMVPVQRPLSFHHSLQEAINSI